jgi:hypothetical protein
MCNKLKLAELQAVNIGSFLSEMPNRLKSHKMVLGSTSQQISGIVGYFVVHGLQRLGQHLQNDTVTNLSARRRDTVTQFVDHICLPSLTPRIIRPLETYCIFSLLQSSL